MHLDDFSSGLMPHKARERQEEYMLGQFKCRIDQTRIYCHGERCLGIDFSIEIFHAGFRPNDAEKHAAHSAPRAFHVEQVLKGTSLPYKPSSPHEKARHATFRRYTQISYVDIHGSAWPMRASTEAAIPRRDNTSFHAPMPVRQLR